MVTEENARIKAANLLTRILEGEITPKEAKNAWPEDGDRDLDVALHVLHHFDDDDDIRKKDAKYAAWQLKEVENMISKLQGGN